MATDVCIALIGNAFAQRLQLPALRWAGGNRVIGIAGSDAAKARRTAEAWDIPLATGDYRELFAQDPDLVVIATPVHLHHRMVLDALETRAAILCEKPLALNVAEAAELAERARGRAAWVDHQLRWSPHRRALRALIAEGRLGTPWHGEFQLQFGSPAWLKRGASWWFDAARGGGALGALGSHMVDLVRSELGEVEAVRAELRAFLPTRPDERGEPVPTTADEFAALWLRLECGALVSLATGVLLPAARGFHLVYAGSAGSLRLEGEELLFAGQGGEDPRPVEVHDDRPKPEELGIPDGGPFARALPLFLRDVIDTVRAGRTELPGAATFADGLATQRVLDAARRSAAAAGGWEPCT